MVVAVRSLIPMAAKAKAVELCKEETECDVTCSKLTRMSALGRGVKLIAV